MTSLSYRGPLVSLTPQEAEAVAQALASSEKGTPAYEALRKCQVAAASDPRFRLPCR